MTATGFVWRKASRQSFTVWCAHRAFCAEWIMQCRWLQSPAYCRWAASVCSRQLLVSEYLRVKLDCSTPLGQTASNVFTSVFAHKASLVGSLALMMSCCVQSFFLLLFSADYLPHARQIWWWLFELKCLQTIPFAKWFEFTSSRLGDTAGAEWQGYPKYIRRVARYGWNGGKEMPYVWHQRSMHVWADTSVRRARTRTSQLWVYNYSIIHH